MLTMQLSSIQRLSLVEMPTCCTKKLGSQLHTHEQAGIQGVHCFLACWLMAHHYRDNTQAANPKSLLTTAVKRN
jgi:hypothetical protein